MDSMEPEQTPFAAVSAQTSKFSRVSRYHASLNNFGRVWVREDARLMENVAIPSMA